MTMPASTRRPRFTPPLFAVACLARAVPTSRRWTPIALWLLAAACAADDDGDPAAETQGHADTTSGDPSAPDTGAETGVDSSGGAHQGVDTVDVPAPGCVVEPDSEIDCYVDGVPDLLPSCGAPEPCAALDLSGDPAGHGDDPPTPIAFDDVATAQCILEALRDGSPALLRIEHARAISSDAWTFEILPAGDLQVTEVSFVDSACYSAERWGARHDAAYFDACLAAPDDAAMLECLVTPLDESNCSTGTYACE